MLSHNQTIVASELLTRACGCQKEFLHFEVDPMRVRRREKFLAKRCPECGQVANDKHNEQQGKVKKGQESKFLPAYSSLHLILQGNGIWKGRVMCPGFAAGIDDESGSLLNLIQKLTKKMVKERTSSKAEPVPA